MTIHMSFICLHAYLCALFIAGAVGAPGETADSEQQAENTPRPFDAQKVAKLSHEAYKIAWDARFWARQDLRLYVSFRPTALDWEVVYYLGEISRKVPWVARDIEKNPATARDSSTRSSDYVRYDAMLLKKRYQPTSFRRATDIKIEKLLGILDEIATYYEEKGRTSSKENDHARH